MLRNTTFNLPDDLVARAESYAVAHGTTMTAIVRKHLEAVTAGSAHAEPDGALVLYSKGLIARRDAIDELGLRDSAELLVMLGDAGLSMPMPPRHEVEDQAADFARLWQLG